MLVARERRPSPIGALSGRTHSGDAATPRAAPANHGLPLFPWQRVSPFLSRIRGGKGVSPSPTPGLPRA